MAQVLEPSVTLIWTPMPLPPLPAVVDGAWPVQGLWTYDDYLNLPDDGKRYEIIEGVLYVTNAPGFDHQFAVQQMAVALELWLRASEMKGVVLLSFPFCTCGAGLN